MNIYIVDIDGTIADCSHRLHFIEGEQKDWDAFFEACVDDKPIRDVIDTIRAIHDGSESSSIVYSTGRPEKIRNKTIGWMMVNGAPNGGLWMRQDGDHRPDTVVKKEFVEQLISEGHRIVGVFEDRPSVVRIWREMGLTVFQMRHDEF